MFCLESDINNSPKDSRTRASLSMINSPLIDSRSSILSCFRPKLVFLQTQLTFDLTPVIKHTLHLLLIQY